MARILVVDDSEQIRQILRLSLEYGGHVVLEAVDGNDGRRAVRSACLDVVILDVAMPGPSGLDVCRWMRADPTLATMPVVIITAGGMTERDALDAGANAFMRKPFSPTALLALVAVLVGA